MTEFDLSICIPTYTRAAGVETLVTALLASNDPRVEVVVLDNGSTDDTLNRLAKLGHARLAVHANAVNRGVLFNILHVLDKARGTFSVLLLDKDHVEPTEVDAFRRFLLDDPALVAGYCEYHSEPGQPAERHRRGRAALEHIAYVGHHPTGYFFNANVLRSLEFTQRFGDFDAVGHFPFDFLFAEMALIGDAAIYHAPIFSPESNANAGLTKSIGTNASTEDAFFSPPGRLKTSIRFARHIETLATSIDDKRTLIAERFLRGIHSATLGYRAVMNSPALCRHYHIDARRVSWLEMLRDARNFYREFIREAVDRGEHDAAGRVREFHRQVAAALWRRARRKLVRSAT